MPFVSAGRQGRGTVVVLGGRIMFDAWRAAPRFRDRSSRRLAAIVGFALLLAACRMAPPADCGVTLTGGDQVLDAIGEANDGVGAPKGYGPFPVPPTIRPVWEAMDGPALARSMPLNFQQLRAIVQQELRGGTPMGIAGSYADSMAESTFTPAADALCRFEIESVATLTLEGGTAGYAIEARIRQGRDTIAGGEFTRQYEFRPGSPGMIEIRQGLRRLGEIAAGMDFVRQPGATFDPDRGPPGGFSLTGGETYIFEFALRTIGDAAFVTDEALGVISGRALIDAAAKATLVDVP